MIRNRYNRIPQHALSTKRERDTYNYDGTTIKTAQVKAKGAALSNRWSQGHPK